MENYKTNKHEQTGKYKNKQTIKENTTTQNEQINKKQTKNQTMKQ